MYQRQREPGTCHRELLRAFEATSQHEDRDRKRED
jgi:hypothetical protein